MNRYLRLSLALLLARTAQAQEAPLSLGEALARADSAAYANRIAAGETMTRDGQAMAPWRGILPSVRVETGYLRTTDPLNAFGFTLRQRTVSAASFNPALLNDPAAIGNMTAGLVLEQPLFNADAWLGRKAATRAGDAARAAQEWTEATTESQVVRAYWGAVLAREHVTVLEAAWAAGKSHLRQAEAMVRQGMATKSDALLAAVKAGELEAELVRARSDAGLARRGLAILMGDPADTAFTLPASLPGAETVTAVAAVANEDSATAMPRGDVRAATLAREAAEADAQRARSLYLPRLNGFGRLDWNDHDTPFGGQSAWTFGVMLSWSPFAGASEIAEGKMAAGRRQSARAMQEAAEAQATLEVARARDAVTVALVRLAIAERATAQAREAHRLVERKYEGGLASVTDLFDAAATEIGSDLAFASARYDALVAAADGRRVRGLGFGPVVSVMESQ